MNARKGYWIYIPTLNRIDCLKVVVPMWWDRGFNVAIVCEPQETESISKALQFIDILPKTFTLQHAEVCPLGRDNGGAGYARQGCLEHAAIRGLDACIIADDDVYPARKPKRGKAFEANVDPGGKFEELLHVVRGVTGYSPTGKPTLACAASYSYHDIATKNKVSNPHCNTLVNLHNGNCYAVNTAIALEIGGFDEELAMWEDAEFMRAGIVNGYPWWLHTGVQYGRHRASGWAGGVDTYLQRNGWHDRDQCERYYRAECHRRWPKYVSAPDKRHRMRWKQMYADYGVPYVPPDC